METSIGEKRASGRYQYSMVMAALLCFAFTYTIIITFLRREGRGRENNDDAEFGSRWSWHSFHGARDARTVGLRQGRRIGI